MHIVSASPCLILPCSTMQALVISQGKTAAAVHSLLTKNMTSQSHPCPTLPPCLLPLCLALPNLALLYPAVARYLIPALSHGKTAAAVHILLTNNVKLPPASTFYRGAPRGRKQPSLRHLMTRPPPRSWSPPWVAFTRRNTKEIPPLLPRPVLPLQAATSLPFGTL